MSSIPRRTFLKTTIAAAGASVLGRFGVLQARPVVATVPTTPFDAPPGTWTLAVLPDTQYYSQRFPEVFLRQTQWLAAHRASHNILFVAHEGDLVNVPTAKKQWANARRAMNVLNEAGMPYSILPGNHDLGTHDGNCESRVTLMNNYFIPDDYRHSAEVGFFEKGRMENSWHRILTPGGDRIFFALEFGPRDEVLAWADQVAAAHANDKTILITHAYLDSDGRRDDWTLYGQRQDGNPKSYPFAAVTSVNDGQDIWKKFVSRHPQIQFVLNGHVCGSGLGSLSTSYPQGSSVRQLLVNFQDNSPSFVGTVLPARGYGGGGFLRLMQFLPDGKTVQVKTFSPWYNQWLTEPGQHFTATFA